MADAPVTEENWSPNARYPYYVRTEADRERWDLITKIAEKYAEVYEGHPDTGFVWYATRQWYFSDIPTGSPEDADPTEIKSGTSNPSPEPNPPKTGSAITHSTAQSELPTEPSVEEAELASGDKQQGGPSDKAKEMFAELQATKPAPGSPREDWYAHMGKVADLLDELFGDPDQYDFGELEVGGDDEIKEALVGMIHGQPYQEMLHPRDRLGKWSQKLGAVHRVIVKNRDGMRAALAAHVAGARVKLGARPGKAAPPTPEALAAAHRALVSGKADREHFMALAAEGGARERQSRLGQARRVAGKAATGAKSTHTAGLIAVVNTLAYIGSEQAEHKHPLIVPAVRHAEEMDELRDHAEITAEQAHRVAEYAMEHSREIGALLRTAGMAFAKAKGIHAAEIEDTDEEPDAVDLDIAEGVLLTLGYT